MSFKDNGIGRKKSNEVNKLKTLKEQSIGISLISERLKHFFSDYKSDYNLEFVDLMDDKKILKEQKFC